MKNRIVWFTSVVLCFVVSASAQAKPLNQKSIPRDHRLGATTITNSVSLSRNSETDASKAAEDVTNTPPANSSEGYRLDIATLISKRIGEVIQFEIPGGVEVDFEVVEHTYRENGINTFVARWTDRSPQLATRSGDYIQLTYNDSSAHGQVSVIGMNYRVSPRGGAGGEILITRERDIEIPKEQLLGRDDVIVPLPPSNRSHLAGLVNQKIAASDVQSSWRADPENDSAKASSSADVVVVDLLVLFSSEYAAGFASSAARDLRLQSDIDWINLAFTNSQVKAALRIVGSVMYAYSQELDNSAALSALQNGEGIFSTVAALRDSTRADLVTFLRPYRSPQYSSAGIANLGGFGYGKASDQREAFSVIGQEAAYSNSWLFAHELGHNLGGMHERANAGEGGAYPDYGYGSSSFGTIMSYVSPKVQYFSNPDVLKCGPSNAACGIAAGPTAANNARVVNNVRCRVANYRSSPDSSAETGTISVVNPETLRVSVSESVGLVKTVILRRSGGNCGAVRAYVSGPGLCYSGTCSGTFEDITITSGVRKFWAGANYGYVEWEDGDTNDKSFQINVVDDVVREDTELVSIGIYGADVVGESQSIITLQIQDNADKEEFDRTPNPFSIQPQINVPLSSVRVSSPTTINGINTFARVTVAAGQVSVGCTDRFTAVESLVMNGDAVCVRHSSAATYGATVTTVLTIEGVSANFSSTTVATPSAPGAPTLIGVSAGHNQVSIAFSAPGSPGSSAVNGYSATCGSVTVTGSASPIVVSPLANGVPVTCTVKATNSVGSSPPSAVSASVTPRAPGSEDSDTDGIPDNVEVLEGQTIGVKDNAIFAGMNAKSDRWFAMQQYRDFLGREAETAGLNGWTGALNAGTQTREQVIQSFFGSQEFQNGVPPVVRLYLGYFNRIPDHDGLFGWVNALRTGTPLGNVSGAFAASQEFQNTYGALSDADFVTLVYRNVLGRTPDLAGYNDWLGRLRAGLTRGNMMIGFTESQEYQNKTRNNVFVIMMYEGMLRRAAEQAGYDGWVNYMNAGNSGLALTSGFLNSLEYRYRFLPR